jgi:hypothetical protein
MAERIYANGLDLRTVARNVESLSGLLTSPPRRGSNIEVPGRHGSIPTANKRYAEGEVVLPLWIKGVDEFGVVGNRDQQLTNFYANLDAVLQTFSAETVIIDHELAAGSTRRALCQLAEPIAFSRDPASPLFGRASIALTIPGAFWTETADRTHTASLATGMGTSATPFAGATAPMDELVITFGPGNNPELGQGEVFLAYDGVIGSGRTLVVNTSTWTAAGTGGLVVDYSKLRHGGSPRWFEIRPEDPAPTLQLSHTGGGSMSVTVTGKRRFLTG